MVDSGRPLVTIAIPTYNRADGFLREALSSALRQTYESIEIFISDNCSTDRTPDLMANYTDDPRVRYVRHTTNLGAHGNFNYCVEAARGDFFLMLHDDDFIDPDFVETCLKAADEVAGRRVGYVRTGVRLIDQHGTVTERHPNGAAGLEGVEALLAWMRCENFWTFSSTLYETASLREVGGFSSDDFPLTCDCYATLQIALRDGGLEVEPIKAGFRRHDGTLTNNTVAQDWIREWYRFYRRTLSLAPSENAQRRFKKKGAEFFSRLCYNYAERLESIVDRWRAYLSVYSKFGGKHLPPPLHIKLRSVRRKIQNILPAIRRHQQRAT